jgi:hypothetical protein
MTRTADLPARNTKWLFKHLPWEIDLVEVLAPIYKSRSQLLKTIPSRRAVLCYLGHCADHGGVSWPSYRAIAAHTSVSEATAKRSLQDLRKVCLLEWARGTGGLLRKMSNRYRLNLQTLETAPRLKAHGDTSPKVECHESEVECHESEVECHGDTQSSVTVSFYPVIDPVIIDPVIPDLDLSEDLTEREEPPTPLPVQKDVSAIPAVECHSDLRLSNQRSEEFMIDPNAKLSLAELLAKVRAIDPEAAAKIDSDPELNHPDWKKSNALKNFLFRHPVPLPVVRGAQ